MTKYEFLGDLSRLLSDLSEEDRGEALQYYEDYFADAGRDQEQAVIQELESPEKVAAKVRGTVAEDVEYGESGAMKDADYPEVRGSAGQGTDSANQNGSEGFTQAGGTAQSGSGGSSGKAGAASDSTNQFLKWCLILVAAVIVIPIVLPTAGGIIIAIICVIFGLFMGLFGTGIGLGIGGVVSMFTGLYRCITADFADAAVSLGAGLVLLPLGIILCYLGGLFISKLAPGIVKLCQQIWDGVCSLGQKIFN